MNKIVEVAKRFLDCLEVRTRESGEQFVCFKSEVIEKDTDEYRKLSSLIWKLKENLSEDFVYWEVYNCLNEIIDLKPETEEGLEDILENIEPDVYTSDLTEWLKDILLNKIMFTAVGVALTILFVILFWLNPIVAIGMYVFYGAILLVSTVYKVKVLKGTVWWAYVVVIVSWLPIWWWATYEWWKEIDLDDMYDNSDDMSDV